jgi:hypothetical protein
MRRHPNPKDYPQKEGHPEPFPEVTTMPKGWDLTGLVSRPSISLEGLQDAIALELDNPSVVQDTLE